jgi:hypothetical protein
MKSHGEKAIQKGSDRNFHGFPSILSLRTADIVTKTARCKAAALQWIHSVIVVTILSKTPLKAVLKIAASRRDRVDPLRPSS